MKVARIPAEIAWTLILGAAAWGQVTQRTSVGPGGVEGNDSSLDAVVSTDGRYVAFTSLATNLVPGDTNARDDVFVRDRQFSVTERVSVSSSGTQANDRSESAWISGDGRYVLFTSFASNLVPSDTNAKSDAFVRDVQAGTTERISVGAGGAQANNASFGTAISPDGRYCVFISTATNLVTGDTNGWGDVFVRDRQSGTTERVSFASDGAQPNEASFSASISADGRYVAFVSAASNLVPGDTNGWFDVFVRDRQSGTTERASVATGGTQGNQQCEYDVCPISADGRYVAFASFSSNLVPGDTNGWYDVFVRDRLNATTERVSLLSNGMQSNGDCQGASISGDGRYVAFESFAVNFAPGGTLGYWNVYVHDRATGETEHVSVDPSGAEGDSASFDAALSADGRYVAFDSFADDLVAGDTNTLRDTFVRDRDATGFASFCDPGVGGVIACPCANPPSGTGRGCENSAATGGASLSASGVAYLSSDSLVFTSSDETPSATSIVLQLDTEVAAGILLGQGVRCAGGTLLRLYVKTASGGSITAPDLVAGDPSISARSTALGDPIQAGEVRFYLVSYRDPFVLGGCPASSTFNATQTARVQWSP